MIQSMTGFGKSECELQDKKLTLEIKALNGKQLDVNLRIPPLYKEKEIEIRQLIAAGLERGKVECCFYYELAGSAANSFINVPVVRDYYEKLHQLAGELGIETTEQTLCTVMRLPDSLVTEKPELPEEEWKQVRDCLLKAIDELNLFRRQEGRSLESDIRERVSIILEKLNSVEVHEKERIETIRERIGNSLSDFLKNSAIDENRLEQEIIFYLEKLDITEEKVRLLSHCNYFLDSMNESGPVGRKLGFISQEMGREINTLGSKANHSLIQKLVVEMKDELEKIKEQLLNVL
ncbi:MAG: YicC family protein [Bacteroidales bacterium]|nr:YicC family protein [Bacteroidales bacterium]